MHSILLCVLSRKIIKMWKHYLWWLYIVAFLNLYIVYCDEDCRVTQKPKLQIIFVQDQVMKVSYDIFVNHLSLAISHLIDLLKQTHFEAEFAVSGYVNYPDSAGPREITNPDLCYFLMQNLTTEKTKIKAALTLDVFPANNNINNNTNTGGNGTQSLTTAMLFSAVDKELNWNHGFYDNKGNLVRKIMIPMTYKGYAKYLQTPGSRTPPKADGTDTCATALIPEIEQLNQVLWDHQFSVIHVILKVYGGHSFEKEYRELFSSLFVPFYQFPVPTIGHIATSDPFNHTEYGKKLYDAIIQEAMSCDWEDPVGYNSLGL